MKVSQRQLTYRTGARAYVFRYLPGDQDRGIEAAAALAADPEHEFGWIDAAMVAYQLGAERRRELDAVVDGVMRDLKGKDGE